MGGGALLATGVGSLAIPRWGWQSMFYIGGIAPTGFGEHGLCCDDTALPGLEKSRASTVDGLTTVQQTNHCACIQ
jgi:hypothetical protein